jgi:hypothetical protein
MSAAWSSARTSLPLNPRVLRSFSSSVMASPAVMGCRLPPASAAGTGSANQTALPRTPVPDSRDLVRWWPQYPLDSSCTTSRPRPLIASAGARQTVRPGTLPRTQPGRVSKTLHTSSACRPVPLRYSQSSGFTGSGCRWLACRVLAASSLTIVTPSSMASVPRESSLATLRNRRRATPAQVGSPGSTHAPHARVRTIRNPSSISVPPAYAPVVPVRASVDQTAEVLSGSLIPDV